MDFLSPKSEITSLASLNFSSKVKIDGVTITFIFALRADSKPLGESSIAIHACGGSLNFSSAHS